MESPEKGGLLITDFTENSVLQNAGAQKNDILWKYNGTIVESVEQLGELKKRVDTELVEVEVLHHAEHHVLQIPAGKIGVYLMLIPWEGVIDTDAVMIKGIGKLDWSSGMDNTFLGALEQIEKLKGQGLGYEDLMLLSGYSFRTNFFEGWCPSSPDATCGFNAGEEILKKLGYNYETIHLKGDEECTEDSLVNYMNKTEMISVIKASIDNGWPVLAIDLIQVPEWGVITGYQKDGKELLCRTYFDQADGYEIAQNIPFAIVIIHGKKEVDLDPLYPEALKLAKVLYETENYNNYTNGIHAIDTWITHLNDEKVLMNASPEKFAEMSLANSYIYYSLAGARALTADYLKKNKEKFDVDQDLLAELSEIYEQEAELLQKGFSNLAALGGSATPETWTIEMRRKELLTLDEFRNLELRAKQLFSAF
ncbi:MAG: hypothetical protein K9M99_11710 [Candidatus Cloacimonetes bacterium]|nr:hypothetical protein [Candidatus Cloacimonadota bacterium]